MNGPSVDEVIVRVETKGEGSSTAPWHSTDPVSSAHINATQNNNGTFLQAKPEPRIREYTNDAIWDELSSPSPQSKAQMHGFDSPRTTQVSNNGIDAFETARVAHHNNSGINIIEAHANAPASNDRLPLSSERMLTQSNSPSLLRGAEPRHRPRDFDIHINEPNLVVLQDSPVNKPLSKDFSFRPKRLDAQIDQTPSSNNSQRIVRMVSSSKSSFKAPTSPLQPRASLCPPLELRVDEEGIEDEEDRRTSDATSLKSESKRRLIDHGMEAKTWLTDGQVSSGKRGNDEGRVSGATSAGAIEKNNRVPRTVTLSKEFVKTKTKSRLVEVSSPSSASTATVMAVSGRFEGAKKAIPQSPTRPSVRKAEVEVEEEDPFKDIDLQDEFRKGNFKAITVAQWVAFIVVMGCLVCSLTLNEFKRRQVWGLELWKWFLLILVVLCGRLVSGWLIRILVIIFEKNFLLRKKVLYFVYGLRKGVQNCLWLGLALLAWKLMFDPRVKRSTANHRTLLLITRLLECFLIAAFIWLGKLLLVKSLASSFHVTAFFERIQESLYNQHVLEVLYGPPLLDLSFDGSHKPARSATVSLARGVPAKKDDPNEPIKIENLRKMSTRNVSAGVMKQLMSLVKHPGIGTLVSTFDENVFVDEDAEEIEINSELQAKAAGKWIFKNVAQEGSEGIEREDLLRFVSPEDIDKVLCLFEGAKDTGKITKKALKNWVVKVYQERRALAHSLNDTKTAVKELHRMSSIVVIIIIIVVWLLVLGIATTHVLLFVSSQLLLVGFMFSNTVKQIFEAIIFLFVMHPFDVGDRCIIDGTQLVVEEMKILSTVFLKPDNEKVFYPNSVLATKPISNWYRSPDMKDFLDFSVHISTPTEKITILKDKLTAYVNSKSEHWQPKFGLLVKELEDLNRMRLSVTMQHTINFQNFGDRMSRRSDLLLELKRIFEELGIEYHLLTQPVQVSYGQAMPSVLANYPPPIVPYQGQVI